MPERNAVVDAFKGKPVKFIAIAAGDTLQDAAAYAQTTGLKMPIFADSLSVLEGRYGVSISLKNIYQFRVIDSDGKVVGLNMDKETIEQALKTAKWKYNWDDYDERLHPVIEQFEWGQYEVGMKQLLPVRKAKNKELAESANKFFNVIRKEGEDWLKEADRLSQAEPLQSLEILAKVRRVFPPDDSLYKETVEPLAKLAKEKAVQDELAARKVYAKFLASLGAATPAQKAGAVTFLQQIAKKYPGTTTAEKAETFAKELAQ